MKASILLSAVLGLAGAVFFLHASAGDVAAPGASCPPSKYVDATNPQTQAALRGKVLKPAFPDRPAETQVVQDGNGVIRKISRQEFVAYDAATGRLLPLLVAHSCSSTCNNKPGQSGCSNNGCDATTSGCSSHSCTGGSCTDGYCSKDSTVENIE